MQSKYSLESLEPRKLLSANLEGVAYIGETGGAVATAKAKAVSAPSISIRQRSLYFNAVRGKTDTQILRITNEGTGNLDIKPGDIYLRGVARTRFSFEGLPEQGISLRPGRRLDIKVTYTSRSADPSEVNVAALVVRSTDLKNPAVTVGLRALPTKGIGGSLEPSLQRVIDTFGLPINVGDTSPDEYQLGTPSADSDEVTMQALVKAGTGPVSIRPLAVFGTDNGPAVRLGTYTPGMPDSLAPLWYVPRENAQSVNPTVYGQTLIDPGDKPFGIFAEFPGFTNTNGMARNVYSEDSLNRVWEPKADKLRKMRFYPFVDQFGNAAPNTYVVAVEEYTSEYDYQDVLYVVTNVKPLASVANVPVLAVTNMSAVPNNDRLVFNKVQIPDENYANTTRLTHTVRLNNNGNANLVLSLAAGGNFSITKGGGSNIVLEPGASREVEIRFNATGGGIHTGALTISSNDPDHATVSIKLVGYWQQYSEFVPSNRRSVEPTAKTVVNDLFGYTTALTNSGQNLSTLGRVARTGDEVLSPYWRQADDAPVKITMLAAFHGQTYLHSNGTNVPAQSFVGWYPKGKPTQGNKSVIKHAKGDGQSVLPRRDPNPGQYTAGQFNPQGQPFGFLVEGKEFSDPKLNIDPQGRTGYGHFVRFWPAYDAEGKLMPNSYIMLHDYNREYTNFDYQDNIFLVQNIIPENGLKSPLTVFTEETSKGARISFTGPATGPKILGFKVYRSTTPRGGYSLLTDTPLARQPVTTFVDTSVVPSQTFYYQITSLGKDGLESQPVTVKI